MDTNKLSSSGNKYIGYTGTIDGKNVNTYECIVCKKKLAQREYLEVVDMCRPCKRKSYNRGQHTYKLQGGNNDIDKILIRNMEETN